MRRCSCRSIRGFAVVGLMLACSPFAAAQSLRCLVVGDDFEPRGARITRFDDSAVQYVDDKSNVTGTLPIERLVRLEGLGGAPGSTDAKPAPAKAGFMLVLRDGQRWMGSPGEIHGDDLEWTAPEVFNDKGLATGRVPLKSIVAIASLKDTTISDLDRAATAAASTQDELRLTNSDIVAGVISAADAKTITCAGADGQPVVVDWTNVRVARFAATAAQTPAAARAPFRLAMRDGRVIDGDRFTAGDDGAVLFTSHGGQVKLAGGDGMISLEHSGGRVRLLAEIAPIDLSQSPYFPTPAATKSPALTPAAVKIGERPFRSSILARPRSSIRWALDGSSKTFATRYGIPAGRSLADVTVRVKLDDAVVHERTHLKAGEVISLLKLPLGAAKSITLEVDYGDTYDVQDDFYWLEPALLAD